MDQLPSHLYDSENSADFWFCVHENWQQGKFLSVGLDIALEQMSQNDRSVIVRHLMRSVKEADANDTMVVLYYLLCHIVESTQDIVCAYKMNLGFFLSLGAEGIFLMESMMDFFEMHYPHIPLILDAKIGDIANTNVQYRQFFDRNNLAKAVTVNPLSGRYALTPFLVYRCSGVFVWCSSSDKRSEDFLDSPCDEVPLYLRIARQFASEAEDYGRDYGLVMGGTYPERIQRVREEMPNIPLLVPGVGHQGGNLEEVVSLCADQYRAGFILHSSRSILYHNETHNTFEEYLKTLRQRTQSFHNRIQSALRTP